MFILFSLLLICSWCLLSHWLRTMLFICCFAQPFPDDLKSTCKVHCSLPDSVLRETIVDRMGSDLMRKTLDLQLIIFTQIVTFLVEELLKGLHAKLTSLVWSLLYIAHDICCYDVSVPLLYNLLQIYDWKFMESKLQGLWTVELMILQFCDGSPYDGMITDERSNLLFEMNL